MGQQVQMGVPNYQVGSQGAQQMGAYNQPMAMAQPQFPQQAPAPMGSLQGGMGGCHGGPQAQLINQGQNQQGLYNPGMTGVPQYGTAGMQPQVAQGGVHVVVGGMGGNMNAHSLEVNHLIAKVQIHSK